MTAKILIVDDHKENLIALEKLLKKVKCEPIRALSGSEALLKCLDEDFAMIITDVAMPEMTGIEMVKTLKDNRDGQEIPPIIFISGHFADESTLKDGYQSGAVDYIQKPVYDEVLLSKVQVFLDLYDQKQDLLIKNRELDAYSRTVAHDFKNVFGAIIMATELLQEVKELPKQKDLFDKYVKNIRLAAENMMVVSHNILHYARLGGRTPDPVEVSVADIFENVLTQFGCALEKSDGKVSIQDNGALVFCDPTSVVQIFANLMSNSIKYRESKRPLKIDVTASQEGDKFVKVLFKDNGIGIKDDEIGRVFNEFVQAGKDTLKHEGLGVGLSTVKRFLEANKAIIELNSKWGEGTEISVFLPIKPKSTSVKIDS